MSFGVARGREEREGRALGINAGQEERSACAEVLVMEPGEEKDLVLEVFQERFFEAQTG